MLPHGRMAWKLGARGKPRGAVPPHRGWTFLDEGKAVSPPQGAGGSGSVCSPQRLNSRTWSTNWNSGRQRSPWGKVGKWGTAGEQGAASDLSRKSLLSEVEWWRKTPCGMVGTICFPMFTMFIPPGPSTDYKEGSRSFLHWTDLGVLSYQLWGLWRWKVYACVCARSLQSCPTLCDPMDCSPPGSSVHGILQGRILECVAMPSSRGSSQPRDQIYVSCLLHW